jgi:GH24 family phage-related lysozyme (muramidase)
MANTATIRPSSLFRYWKALPHQSAAITELESLLLERCPDLFSRDQPWFKTWSQSGKHYDCSEAFNLIKEFEGLSLVAYADPLSGKEPYTIGYGMTAYLDGRPIQKGDTLTSVEADIYLRYAIDRISTQLSKTIPGWNELSTSQRCALISFAYNLGTNFYGSPDFQTITKKLADKNWSAVPAALLLYCNPGTPVEAGLKRRREAEGKLWSTTPAQPPQPAAPATPVQQAGAKLPLDVPYFSQRDSRVPGQAPRSCFSSSCAMLLAFLKPGTLTGPNGDDAYLRRVLTFGDSTDATAQLKALASYGVQATLKQNADWIDLHQQLGKGIPVPCGFLHKGPSSSPSGGGHWLTVIGIDSTNNVTVNDPWGEMAVAAGTYLNPNGAGLTYSAKNWGPRWLVEGPYSGWAIIAKAP